MSNKLIHPPTGNGIGKWEDAASLTKYIAKRNKKNKIAKESRRKNRGQ